MAAGNNDNNTQSPTNPSSDDLNQELRQSIADAYSFVEGAKTSQTFSSLTFEDLMAQQITILTGPDTPQRPNVLNRISSVVTRAQDAITKIQQLPPDFFTQKDNTDAVNTELAGDDPYSDGVND
jgi:hypothetical protein